ncbi:efflux RND transporter permease subunit [Arhodomonas sp. SL1]|uniref:efflux RND transporter permease subunit n=1 Tax=Arhodomonas sp. SL1 TaxID=3425691 RepID=UPI003F8850C1
MRFTDVFIRRPVLSTVVSLLILLVGLRSLGLLELRQYPELENTVVTVSTAYPGASSDLVKGFVTTPLQQAIAEAEGIDYISATSTQGSSTIEVHMELNYDPNAAVAEIQAKVASQRNVLPQAARDPVIESSTGDSTALMYLSFYSDELSVPRVTDYLVRVIQPQIQAVPGVAKARLFGKPLAMRVWLDPDRMAALGVTPEDVTQVLRANNYLAGVGQTKGKYTAITLTATTDVSDPDSFQDLIIRGDGDTLVRLSDIARSELDAESYDSEAWYKGQPAVFMAVEQSPGANPLDTAQAVERKVDQIREQLPEGMDVVLPYDASEFIEDSINEVFKTIAEAVGIVLLVIYLSLGSFRAAVVPAVAVPLSLIGAAFIMLALGYSLNLLTLLSMVLAIGLVVDDAIIVVENIHRHIEDGESNFRAALYGARELAVPIIAMTTTLVAVYAPIGFMGGLLGTLFTEFAFTLAGAVLVSGVVALTFSPMLSSKVLKPYGNPGRFERLVERVFNGLARGYRALLARVLETVSVMVVFGVAVLASIYFMFITAENELAPTEDQGIIFFQATAPRTATLDYLRVYGQDLQSKLEQTEGYKESFIILGRGGNTLFGGFKMPNFAEREISQFDALPLLQDNLREVAGFDISAFPRPSLPGSGGGLPIQFVMTSGASYEDMNAVADEIVNEAMGSGNFQFLQKSIAFDRPSTTVVVDRDRAGDLGISMEEIGRNLSAMLGGDYVNRFSMDGRSYQVIPQVERRKRLDEEMLGDYYIRADTGELVPMSTLVSFERTVEPSERTQFQQLNSLTLEGIMAPGVTIGAALSHLEQTAAEVAPQGYGYDYTGASRQFKQQGTALMVTFFLSLLVIYLVLAAQFESWRDPFIILVSVPLSIAGAMAFITLGFTTVNIYTQVGLITLIGVVAKNGILIVEFANQQQIHKGLSKVEAVLEAGTIRLRPIIMTSVALIVAMIPLLTASGPGAVSRFAIGLTVATGLGIGTLFTLFVLPAFYVLLGREHAAETATETDDPEASEQGL